MDERLMALKLGLPLQFIVKEQELSRILGNLASLIDNRTILKGGTAINFAYLHKRFSEDLDFDCFGCKHPVKSGFEGPFKLHNTWRYHFPYDLDGARDNIRVEITEKKGWDAVKKYVKKQPLEFFHGSIIANIPIYTLKFLAASKIMLLSQRQEGKDFFDAYWALRECVPKKEINAVEELENVKDIVSNAIISIEKASPKQLALTNNYIPRSNRPKSWKLLLDELKEMLKELL